MADIQQQILIEHRISNEAKSPVVAYLLWFFTGSFGGHRFYLGKSGSGAIMLAMCLIGLATAVFMVGFVLLIPLWIWTFVDAFLIPGIISESRNELRNRLLAAAPRV